MLDLVVPNTTFRDWVHYAGGDQGPVMLVCSRDWSLVSHYLLFRLHTETRCYQQESSTRRTAAIGVMPPSNLGEIVLLFSTVSDPAVSMAGQLQVTTPDGVNIGLPFQMNIDVLTLCGLNIGVPCGVNIGTPCWENMYVHYGYHTTALTQVNMMAHHRVILPAHYRVITAHYWVITARYQVIMPAHHRVIMPALHRVIMPAHHRVIMPACHQVILPAHYRVIIPARYQVIMMACDWVKKYMHRTVNQVMCNQENMSAHSWVIKTVHNLNVSGSNQAQYNHVNQIIKISNSTIVNPVLNQCIYCSTDIVLLHQYSFINQFLKQPTIQYPAEYLQGHFGNLRLADSSSISFGTWARHIMLIIMDYRSAQVAKFLLLWSHSSYSFFQTDMSLLVHCSMAPKLQCIRVNLLLRRSMYRKHDFAVLLCTIPDIFLQFSFTELVRYQEYLFCCQLKLIYASVCIYKPYYFVSPWMEKSAFNQSNLHENTAEISTDNCDKFSTSTLSGGGGNNEVFEFAEFSPFIISTSISLTHSKTERLKFVEHTNLSDAEEKYKKIPCIISNIPLHCLVKKLFNETIRNISTQHGIFLAQTKPKRKCKIHTRLMLESAVQTLYQSLFLTENYLIQKNLDLKEQES